MFFGWFDAIFSFIFPILFLLFIGMFFFALISNLRTWNKNNHSPRLTVPATVVAKRTDVSHSSSANAGDMSGAHGYDTSTFTSYYVTFQVESGDRMEFEVDGSDYGLLVQGDIGKLSFQGTRYLGFERSYMRKRRTISGEKQIKTVRSIMVCLRPITISSLDHVHQRKTVTECFCNCEKSK